MLRVSSLGKSSTTSSRLVLLNSVLDTLRACRLRSLASATTTQNLLLSTKVELATFRFRRFSNDHSLKQLIKSVTVALDKPAASSSWILWPLNVLSPFTESFDASLNRTFFNRVDSLLKSVKTRSLSSFFWPSLWSSCSDSSVWKKVWSSLNRSLVSPSASVTDRHSFNRLSQM